MTFELLATVPARANASMIAAGIAALNRGTAHGDISERVAAVFAAMVDAAPLPSHADPECHACHVGKCTARDGCIATSNPVKGGEVVPRPAGES